MTNGHDLIKYPYRRNHPHMQKMMQIINGDPKLYDMFIKTLKIVFESTPYPSLCSIRVDILMNYHDNDFSEVMKEEELVNSLYSMLTCHIIRYTTKIHVIN